MKTKYLSIDAEFGGLFPEASLLTLAILPYDENFKRTEGSIYWELKPDDGIYHVEAGGLAVNGINLVEHDARAKPYKEVKTTLYNWLSEKSNAGENKLVVVGKNVHGDIRKIWQFLLKRETWEHFVSYQHLDLSSVFAFMQSLGYYREVSGSLDSLAKHFGIKGTLHNAEVDASVTMEILKLMRQEFSHVVSFRIEDRKSV